MHPFRTLGALAATTAVAAAVAAPASAAPTGDLADFRHCPYANPAVTQCLYATIGSGAIKLGNQSVPIRKPIVLQGGIEVGDDTSTPFYDADGAPSLSRTPLDVPGGLLGLVSSHWLFGPLLDTFNRAIAFANGVQATAEQVGPIRFSLANTLNASGTAVELPVRVKLDNPFLGRNCYVGSASAPMVLRLTTGTTTPPSGVAPLTGAPGTLGFNEDFSVTTVSGMSLVDNTFAAPKASGCGVTFIDRALVTLAVNAKIGLPAAPGASSAVMNGTSKLAASSAVVASAGG